MRVRDITNQRFGKLIAIERTATPEGRKGSYWKCQCDCGSVAIVALGNLGRCIFSCGCLHRKTCGDRARKPLEEVIVTQILSYYKRNAKLRNIPWLLTRDQFRGLILSPCFYCGETKGNSTKTTWSAKGGPNREMTNNGIDRKDNTLGYSLDNSVSCCKHCNFAKHSFTLDEFREWIIKTNRYLESNPW
jgi:hypothetical protein